MSLVIEPYGGREKKGKMKSSGASPLCTWQEREEGKRRGCLPFFPPRGREEKKLTSTSKFNPYLENRKKGGRRGKKKGGGRELRPNTQFLGEKGGANVQFLPPTLSRSSSIVWGVRKGGGEGEGEASSIRNTLGKEGALLFCRRGRGEGEF